MVEGARLESVYTGNRIAGSNPAPSATYLSSRRRFGQQVSIARSDNKLNVLILTAGTLDTIARQATCLVFGETANPRNTSKA